MRITSLAWGALLSLVLILIPIVIVVRRDKPHGLPLQIAYQEKECFDNRRLVIAQVLANGKVRVFDSGVQDVGRSDLAHRLHEAFKTKAQHILYVMADSGLPVKSVAEVIDLSRTEADAIAIVTPAAQLGDCLSMRPPRAFFN